MNLEDLQDRDRAETVPCPLPPLGCGADSGEPCTRSDGRGGRAPLCWAPAHTSRVQAAGVVHAPIDSRELRAPHERTPR